LAGGQLVLTTAADTGEAINGPRMERTVTVPLGMARLRTDGLGNAWVYDGAHVIETFEACEPLHSLEEIARKVMAAVVDDPHHAPTCC